MKVRTQLKYIPMGYKIYIVNKNKEKLWKGYIAQIPSKYLKYDLLYIDLVEKDFFTYNSFMLVVDA